MAKMSKGEKKISKVMKEFKEGEMHSGTKEGPVVTNPKQAIAIALSVARKAGAKIPKKAAAKKNNKSKRSAAKPSIKAQAAKKRKRSHEKK